MRLVRAVALTPALPVLLVLVLLSGCGGLEGTNSGGYISGNGQVVEYAAADRSEPVELAGETLDGKQLDVVDLRGKPVVLNIWWSGCGPCASEMPMLQQVHEDLGTKVGFVGINIRDNSEAQGASFQRRFGVKYPSLYSPDGQAVLAFEGGSRPRTVPATVVLDPEGRVAAVIRGEIPSRTTLEDVIEEATTA